VSRLQLGVIGSVPEIIGGIKNGYVYFSDEGIDVGQRGKELAAYYHRVLEPAGEVPLYAYVSKSKVLKAAVTTALAAAAASAVPVLRPWEYYNGRYLRGNTSKN
jgi:hypothetical protein